MSRRKQVLFVSTDHRFRNFATRYLAGFLAQNGVDSDILFIPSSDNDSTEDGASKLLAQAASWVARRRHYDIVGISLMTGGYLACREFLTQLKMHGVNAHITIGGIHALRRPLECRSLPGVTSVVMGPGEYALLDLLNGVREEDIPETYNEELGWRRLPIKDLPFPLYDFARTFRTSPEGIIPLTEEEYSQAQPWIGACYYLTTGFGCPYRCSYCSNPNAKLSRMSVDRAISELMQVKESWSRIQAVDVQDESFFYHDDEWIKEFCRQYRIEIDMPLIIRMMPRFVIPSRIKQLAGAGLRIVKMGLQGSERLNRDLYGRPETRTTFITAMETLRNFGVGAEVDVILDNPWENQSDLEDMLGTLNCCAKPFWVHAYGLTLYPGTSLENKANAEKIEGRFATDPYKSELWARSNLAYMTPHPWRYLIQNIVGWANPGVVEKLSQLRCERQFASEVDILNSRCPYTRKEELLQRFLGLPVPV